MPRGNGGVIGPANIPTTSSAKGVWSLTEVVLAVRQSIWPSPPPSGDPYFEYTTLLLPGNGTNGAQNNTFLDGSTNNFTITRNGNTTQGTFSPFSQTGWGNYFDGTGDYLDIATNAAFDFGSGDFTIECWAYLTTSSNAFSAIISCFNVAGANPSWCLGFSNTTNQMAFFPSYFSPAVTFSYSSYYNTWTHIAVTRSGTSLRLFANGALVSSATDSTTVSTGSKSLRIGSRFQNDSNYLINGYLSNLRIVKGTAVYTSAFTPPTAPLTAISGTSLLTCQSNRFRDASSNNFAITVNGNTSVQAFSPFNPTASWSAATYGGSGYFDGNGDYLTAGNNAAFNLAGGDFTIEAWVYFTALPALDSDGQRSACILSYADAASSNQGYVFSVNFTTLLVNLNVFQGAGKRMAASFNPALNTWYHIACTRSTSTDRIFVNGISQTLTTNTFENNSCPNGTLKIGAVRLIAGYDLDFPGYISNARIVKGTAVYTANFTPPTAPLTNITNTSLLLNFTNGGIYDATSKNDLETVGNAQISTTQSKWGGSSIYVDGTGDRLFNGISSPLLNLSSGDWTIESWVYFNAVGAYAYVLNLATAPANPSGLVFGINNSSRIYIGNGAVLGTNGNTTLSTGQWYYLAAVKSGSNVTLYVNGTADVTPFAFTPNSGTYLYVGADASAGNQLNAYLQDVRITRYARTITASPTAAFPTL